MATAQSFSARLVAGWSDQSALASALQQQPLNGPDSSGPAVPTCSAQTSEPAGRLVALAAWHAAAVTKAAPSHATAAPLRATYASTHALTKARKQHTQKTRTRMHKTHTHTHTHARTRASAHAHAQGTPVGPRDSAAADALVDECIVADTQPSLTSVCDLPGESWLQACRDLRPLRFRLIDRCSAARPQRMR